MLQLCSDGHEEVCFEAGQCPACKLFHEGEKVIKHHEGEVENWKQEVLKSESWALKAEKEVTELRGTIDGLRAQIERANE